MSQSCHHPMKVPSDPGFVQLSYLLDYSSPQDENQIVHGFYERFGRPSFSSLLFKLQEVPFEFQEIVLCEC